MENTRTKVEALKDLGDKVTGTTINIEQNETIVGMLDKITENYTGGSGGSGSSIVLNGTTDWISVKNTPITDDENVAKLNSIMNAIQNDEAPSVFLKTYDEVEHEEGFSYPLQLQYVMPESNSFHFYTMLVEMPRIYILDIAFTNTSGAWKVSASMIELKTNAS